MSRLYLQHPEDDQLLAYSDGELEGLAARRIRRHLKECWRCRTQLEDLQATVTGFMRYKENILENNLPAPPGDWKNLVNEFERIDRITPPASLTRRIASRIPGTPVRVATAAAAFCALAAAGYVGFMRNEPAQVQPVIQKPEVKAALVDSKAFSPAPLISEVRAKAPSPDQPIAPPPQPQGNSEVKVVAALHRAGADLGEPIEVSRDADGSVVITAIAIAPGRREELKAALAGIPGVRLRWEETLTPTGRDRQAASIQAHKLPWQSELEAALGGASQLERFTNQALDLSDQISSRAFALRALNTRFASATLTVDEKAEVARITADHRREFQSSARQLRSVLAPLIERLGGKLDANVARGGLFESSRKVDQAVNSLLAGAGSARTLDEILPELVRAMSQLMKAAED